MEDSLVVKNLSKKYKNFSLNDVSFLVPKGSIMGLIGENGAGKTTTIKAIMNLIKLDGGCITVLGKSYEDQEQTIKESIGIVLDDCYFHDNLKAHQIGRMMSNIYRNWDNKYFDDLLKKFHLPTHKIIKEFSKGMKVKLSIAVALSHHPKLLVLDEATSGLDPLVRDELLVLFLEFIQEEDHSILFSSHITSDLEKIADYITFLHDGSLVFSESKDELLDRHGLMKLGKHEFSLVHDLQMIGYREHQFGFEVLIDDKQAWKRKFPNALMDQVNIETIMLYYARKEQA